MSSTGERLDEVAEGEGTLLQQQPENSVPVRRCELRAPQHPGVCAAGTSLQGWSGALWVELILRASSTSYKLFELTYRGQERYLCKQELPGQQLGVHTDNFQCWKFSLAFRSNSSIRDRILTEFLFTQNPAVNCFPGKALQRAMPRSLCCFWQTSLRKCPEERGRDIAWLCALPQLPWYRFIGKLNPYTMEICDLFAA